VSARISRLTSMLFGLALTCDLGTLPARAQPIAKLGIYGIRMEPTGEDAKDFSRAGWGAGIHLVVPVPQVANAVAGTIGFEYVNLLEETVEFRDPVTGLRVEQQTSQSYSRLYLGPEVGGHGSGFLRPYAGVNLAAIFYGISTDVVVPDDQNREKEIRQNLESRNRVAFGYDVTLGSDLNFGRFLVEGGVKFTKSFNVPQQLGAGAVTIHPGYFQIYLGVGANLSGLAKVSP
jgi:hypothetical protein